MSRKDRLEREGKEVHVTKVTEKKNVSELLKSGRITDEEASVMVADIEHRMKNLNREKMSHDDRVREKPKNFDVS